MLLVVVGMVMVFMLGWLCLSVVFFMLMFGRILLS